MVKHFLENYQSDTILFEKHALTALSLIEILSIFFILINKPCYEVQYHVFNGLFFGILFILMFRWLLSTIGYSSFVIRCKLTPVTFGFFFLLTAIHLFLKVYKYPLDTPIDIRIGYPHGIMITFILGWIISLFDKRHQLLKIGAPLLLLPLTILIASETQYIGLLRGYQWSLKTLLFLFTGSLLGFVIYIYTTALTEEKKINL